MKILYISKSNIPSRSANSIHVIKMCQAFSDNGHEVVMLAPNIKKKFDSSTEDIYKYYGVKKNFVIKKLWHPDNKIGALIYTLSIFFFLLFKKNFDIVYGRFMHGCYIAALLKNKVIYEAHAQISHDNIHKKIIFQRLVKNKYFIKLVVISKALKKIYQESGLVNNCKIQIAHDGADKVTNFNKKAKLFGLKKNLKVGYIGHLYKGKSMEVIKSLENKLDENIEIHIVGGLEEDIEYWKNQISSKNIFFYGFIPHGRVSDYINAFDICLLPNQKIVLAHGSGDSRRFLNIGEYTSPLKLFEYMSHRKGIISSDLPVIREVLNETNSILVKCDDVEAWVSSIKYLSDSIKRKKIANQALSDFSKFTWKNRALELIKFL